MEDREFQSLKSEFYATALVEESPLQREISQALGKSSFYLDFVENLDELVRAVAEPMRTALDFSKASRITCSICGKSDLGVHGSHPTSAIFFCAHCALVEILFRTSDPRIRHQDAIAYERIAEKLAVHARCLFCSASLDLLKSHVARTDSNIAWA